MSAQLALHCLRSRTRLPPPHTHTRTHTHTHTRTHARTHARTHTQAYYGERDLWVGAELLLHGRRFLLTEADEFTYQARGGVGIWVCA